MRVIVLSRSAPGERGRPPRRADPRRRRRRCERGHRAARLAARPRPTRRASSRASCCPTRPSSSGGRATRPTHPAPRRSDGSRSAGSRMPRAAPIRVGALETLGAQLPRRATPTSPWTRLTLWRAQLAAVLDQPPYEPVTARHGDAAPRTRPRPSCWPRGCRLQLQVPVQLESPRRSGRAASTGSRSSASPAPIELERSPPNVATLVQPGPAARHDISLPRRSLA